MLFFWLEIMLGVLWEVINIKDDDLHGRHFNNVTNPFVITLVITEQTVAKSRDVFSQLPVFYLI